MNETLAVHPGHVTELECGTMRRVARCLQALLILCCFVAYLDRVNVSLAERRRTLL